MWIARLFGRRRLERELDAELRFHADEERDRLVRRGLSPDEARRRALAAFGGFEPIKEAARDARGTRWAEDLWRDLRYAVRMMQRQPGFTVAVVLSLAVGIGANAAIFSVMDALVLRPLDVATPSELVYLNETGVPRSGLRFSRPALARFQAEVTEAAFAGMTWTERVQVSDDGRTDLATGQLVTGGWFDVLGLEAERGRLLTPADDQGIDGAPVAVLNDAYWTTRFGRDPAIVGRTIDVNGAAVTIVGVAPPRFDGLTAGERVDLWAPAAMQHALRCCGQMSDAGGREDQPWGPQDQIAWLGIIARVRPPATPAALADRIDTVFRQHERALADTQRDPVERAAMLRRRVELLPGARGLSPLRDEYARALGLLLLMVGAVVLVVCANLTGLLSARHAARGQEFALRLSLGAKRSRLVRQLLTEVLVLALLGGAAALAVAQAGAAALVRLASTTGQPIPLTVGLSGQAIAFTAAAALTTGLLIGLLPAWRLARADAHTAVKSGGRVLGPSDRRGRLPAGRLLVASQVAVSLALLVVAAAFLQTFRGLLAVDAGYDRAHVLSAWFEPGLAGYTEHTLPALYERLLAAARGIPGVSSATIESEPLASGAGWTSGIVAEGAPRLSDREAQVREDCVGPDYLTTVGIRLLRGRDLTARDNAQGRPVALVNEAMARHFFPTQNPIGRHFGYDTPDVEIVGEVADVKVDGPDHPAPPMVYFPALQRLDDPADALYIRVAGSPGPYVGELRRAVAQADPALAIRGVATLGDLTERRVGRERLVSQLTAVFGLLALAAACLGLYGTVSFAVARRTNEIGVRLALGATPGGIRRLVFGETASIVGVGVLAGLALSAGALELVRALLYGVSPGDLGAYGVAAVALVVASLAAGAIPAWRASRLNPVTALRTE